MSGERKEKAVVLAAGFGTRLRPFTRVVPKPLLPVWGEPMLARAVAALRSWGVNDIAMNCHCLADGIESWCAANGCRCSREPEILGTGGALNPLREWIGGDDFWLVAGDAVFELPGGRPFAGAKRPLPAGARECGECLVCRQGPRTIEVEPESGLVACWRSPDAGAPGTFTYCGVARLRNEILRYVEPQGFSTIVQAYERAASDGLFLRAEEPEGMLWTDAGTVESYIEINGGSDAENALDGIPQVASALEALPPEARGAVSFLCSRGSDRCFFSIGGKAVAVVYDGESRPENARYAGHARWLASKGLPVPAVLADVPEMATLVMENAGASRKMSFDEYAAVVTTLARFNALNPAEPGGVATEEAFGPTLWAWERGLFEEHCLRGRFGMEMPGDVRRELEGVADALDAEPPALVHRDFQSENILWKGGTHSIIDFQGMRMGPAAYDLASLLYDPYAKPGGAKAREALAALYGKESGRPEIARILPLAAVQRLVQCLGAYGRLASVGKPGFLVHVPAALDNLLEAADEAGLDAVGGLAEELVARESRMRAAASAASGSGGCAE